MSAQLMVLTDAFVSLINAAPIGTWSNLTVGPLESDFIKAQPALDPEVMFEANPKGVYVVPVTMLYNRATSVGRQRLVQINRGPVIAVCMSYRFETVDGAGLDVSTWEKTKQLLDLREEIDLLLLRQQWEWNIAEVTSEPAQEIPLKSRWFLSVTEYEFSGMTC